MSRKRPSPEAPPSAPGEPQRPSAEERPIRDALGRIAPGATLNPGGQPQWLRDVKAKLEAGNTKAADYLLSVIDGKETAVMATKDGPIDIPVQPKDRIAAVKVVFEYTIPKPRPADDDGEQGANPMAALAAALLARLAGGGPNKP